MNQIVTVQTKMIPAQTIQKTNTSSNTQRTKIPSKDDEPNPAHDFLLSKFMSNPKMLQEYVNYLK